MYLRNLLILSALLFVTACARKQQAVTTPWGETIGDEEGDTAVVAQNFSYNDILDAGEIIMLTMSGPDSYFDYHGRAMGTQYLLCERFAQKIGVSVRVEVCKDTADMIKKLQNGDGDIIVWQLARKQTKGLLACGASTDSTSWVVRRDSKQLADSLRGWYRPALLAQVKKEERYAFSTANVRRHVYAPMLNAAKGEISSYDHYFKMYAAACRWDWRLMAAQCYQESTFDPKAYSWAGARGLMQIMPSTAASLGLSEGDMYNPEANIAAAARYIVKLNGLFGDVRSYDERINFVLASYNGGHFHVRDAMALARKNGRNPYRWADVADYVLKLTQPAYYNDPVVKYGYMRGTETVDYVARIRSRWEQYCGKVKGGGGIGTHFNMGGGNYEPRKAQRKNRFKIKE